MFQLAPLIALELGYPRVDVLKKNIAKLRDIVLNVRKWRGKHKKGEFVDFLSLDKGKPISFNFTIGPVLLSPM